MCVVNISEEVRTQRADLAECTDKRRAALQEAAERAAEVRVVHLDSEKTKMDSERARF